LPERKILFLSDINSSHTQKWALGMASAGFKVGIFSLSKAEIDWFSKKGIFVFDQKNKMQQNDYSEVTKISYLFQISRLKKVIKEFAPDIIHAHYATSYGLLGALSRFHPFFISVWGSDVFEFPRRSFLHRLLLKYNLEKADRIFSTSRIMAERTMEYTGKKIEVIPFGIDTNLFSPVSKHVHENEIVIGTVKSLEKIYALDVLIHAFAMCKKHLPQQNLKLLIVGDGTERKKLEALVIDLSLAGHVEFKGRVPHEAVVDYYHRFDIFVNISRFESFGVSVLEASACGLPVLLSVAGGLEEVGVQDSTCLFVKPGDVDATAHALMSLVQNRKLRDKLGQGGRKFVEENYDIQHCIEKMKAVYESNLT
jgi:glycosyltransferase involved in cell wall biosynthesis